MSPAEPRTPGEAPAAQESLVVSRDLAGVDTARWDALLGPRGFYTATPWLRHAQATAGAEPYYLTLDDQDGPAAALAAYPLEQDTPYVFCSPGRVTDTIHRQVTGDGAPWTAELMPALACGGRNPSHTKAGLRGDLTDGRRRTALRRLVRSAEERARRDGLRSVSFLYTDEDDTELRTVLAEEGYTALVGQSAYSLEVPAQGGFDGYLRRFDQRRRNKIKRELRALDEAGVRYRTSALTPELIERIAPLEMALYAKHGTPADPDAFLRVLHSIAANVGAAARVTTAEVDGRLAGFVLFFGHGGEFYARQAGFDYELKGRIPLYFGLVYYELLRVALSEGVTAIHYSTGSDTVKLSRGCTGRRQLAHLKAFDPGLAGRLQELAAAQRAGRGAAETI
ncbi:GNAT family N-acetyltransferase [Kitasatospora sp. NPDC093550]|uniref:GNAT family N-acetyltransferase n=1 Tax=Kitasatospora sp. NPDC093550 TaxID=3364089 RepID=UPI0037FB6996